VALIECWYSQPSSTLTPSAGGGGKGSPSSPGKNNYNNNNKHLYFTLYISKDTNEKSNLVKIESHNQFVWQQNSIP